MRILCNKSICNNYKKLSKPEIFKPSKNFEAFIDDIATGECKLSNPSIKQNIYSTKHLSYNQNSCLGADFGFICSNTECASNEDRKCSKSEIFIDSSLISGDFICKCFSNKKISGRINIMSILNSDGTAKGGQIDDNYAAKLSADSKKYKIFQDGSHKESK
jgi:hypothetical protein